MITKDSGMISVLSVNISVVHNIRKGIEISLVLKGGLVWYEKSYIYSLKYLWLQPVC